MIFMLLGPLLYLWPKHRPMVRETLAETLIGWALKIAPPGDFRNDLAEYILDTWGNTPGVGPLRARRKLCARRKSRRILTEGR